MQAHSPQYYRLIDYKPQINEVPSLQRIYYSFTSTNGDLIQAFEQESSRLLFCSAKFSRESGANILDEESFGQMTEIPFTRTTIEWDTNTITIGIKLKDIQKFYLTLSRNDCDYEFFLVLPPK